MPSLSTVLYSFAPFLFARSFTYIQLEEMSGEFRKRRDRGDPRPVVNLTFFDNIHPEPAHDQLGRWFKTLLSIPIAAHLPF